VKFFALALLALNPVLWASFYAVTKTALTKIDPIAFSFMEMCVAAVPVIFVAFGVRHAFNMAVFRRGLLLGTVLYGAVLSSTVALYFTTATDTAFFPALNGIMGAIIAAFLFRQKIHGITWFAGILSLAGAIFLIYLTPGNGTLHLGDFIALIAAFVYTIYVFCVGTSDEDNPRTLAAVFSVELCTMAILAGIAFVISLSFHHIDAGLLADNAPLALYVGFFTTFLPTAIALYFQRYAGSVTVSFLYVLEPVWGAIAAHFVDKETLNAAAYLGGSLIVIGSILETMRSVCSVPSPNSLSEMNSSCQEQTPPTDKVYRQATRDIEHNYAQRTGLS
jgi:drug/metabolite transporter (DMT)-like permease